MLSVHWHSFLDERPGHSSWTNILYQRMAFFLLPHIAEFIITTSPRLKDALRSRFPKIGIDVLPCSLDRHYESQLLKVKERSSPDSYIRVVFIGRLDSYKRVDWLIEALLEIPIQWRLSVIGDGPKRQQLELMRSTLPVSPNQIIFYGKVAEEKKLDLLSKSHLLVLPSDRCNEAFGIVQLEAMASGIPALSFDYSPSGMAWVSDLISLPWTHHREDLSRVISDLTNSVTYSKASREARDRYINLFCFEKWQMELNDIVIRRLS